MLDFRQATWLIPHEPLLPDGEYWRASPRQKRTTSEGKVGYGSVWSLGRHGSCPDLDRRPTASCLEEPDLTRRTSLTLWTGLHVRLRTAQCAICRLTEFAHHACHCSADKRGRARLRSASQSRSTEVQFSPSKPLYDAGGQQLPLLSFFELFGTADDRGRLKSRREPGGD